MDPKMDSGCLQPGETLFDDFDAGKDLLPEEVLGIMDQMLCYEMAWHRGHPLSQTLFTSLHIDHLLSQQRLPRALPSFIASSSDASSEPGPLVQTVLRAYCIGMVKSCDIAIELIASQNYHEDEDFSTNTFNRDLLTDIADEMCIELLDNAIRFIESDPGCEGNDPPESHMRVS